jgi:hypothetical protein
MKEYTLIIPLDGVEGLKKKVSLLARHARRLGIEEPTITVNFASKRELPQTHETLLLTEDGQVPVGGEPKVRIVEVVDVVLASPDVGAASGEYRSVAALQHLGSSEKGEKMVEVFARATEDAQRAEPYRTETFCCEHCKLTRRRVWSILVERISTGDILQLGSECAEHYVADPLKVIDQFQFQDAIVSLIRDMESCCDGRTYMGGGSSIGVADAMEVATHCMASVRQFGWGKRWEGDGMAKFESSHSTGVAVAHRLNFRPANSLPRGALSTLPTTYEITDTDRLEARQAINWIATCETEDEFLTSLKLLYGPGWISEKKIYQAAALAIAWSKEKERRLAAERPPSEHQGQLKERMQVELHVTRRNGWQTDFGYKTAYTMEDRSGNSYVWMTTSLGFPETANDTNNWFLVKGTVKKHSEFRGVKQTELTRLTIERDFAAEIAEQKREALEAQAKQIADLPGEEMSAAIRSIAEADLLEILYRSIDTPPVRQAVLANPATPLKILWSAIHDYDDAKHLALAANPALQSDMAGVLVAKILDARNWEAANNRERGVDTSAKKELALRLCVSPQVAGEQLEMLAQRFDKDVRREIFQNPNILTDAGHDALGRLVEDEDIPVAEEARKILDDLLLKATAEVSEESASAVAKRRFTRLFALKSRVDRLRDERAAASGIETPAPTSGIETPAISPVRELTPEGLTEQLNGIVARIPRLQEPSQPLPGMDI